MGFSSLGKGLHYFKLTFYFNVYNVLNFKKYFHSFHYNSLENLVEN